MSGVYFQERDKDLLKENLLYSGSVLLYSGSVDPTDVGSLGNIFSWKGFRLNAYITYSFGNVIRLDPVFRSTYDDLNSMPREFKNRWTIPGDEAKTDIPVIASYWQNRIYANSSSYLSYARTTPTTIPTPASPAATSSGSRSFPSPMISRNGSSRR